ncbi:MAG: hypothetical protein MJZ45_06020, partial [Bacteroidales bacterium]|nr:hypothetical protein [Bacteroidales bacterium]
CRVIPAQIVLFVAIADNHRIFVRKPPLRLRLWLEARMSRASAAVGESLSAFAHGHYRLWLPDIFYRAIQ